MAGATSGATLAMSNVTTETDSTGSIELSVSGYASLDSVKWTNLSVICRDGERREEEGAYGTDRQ